MKAAERAYHILRSGIIDGKYPPGSRVIEQDVAAETGVSRTPVREAMRRLHAEGLLELEPHQGAFVRTWSDRDAEEIFELRAILESFSAERAATHASDEEIAELRDTAQAQYEEVQARKDGYLERIVNLNDRFHKLLVVAARSERLASILKTLADAPLIFETLRDYSQEELQRSARHHLEIVEALEAHDGQWAASVMRSHVRAARHTLAAVAKQSRD